MEKAKVNQYLAKGGKIFGPYTDLEIDQMRRSNEISDYSWIWSHQHSDWIYLDSKPLVDPTATPISRPVAVSKSESVAFGAESDRLAFGQLAVGQDVEQVTGEEMEVIALHPTACASGVSSNMTKSGLELVSAHQTRSGACFPVSSKIQLSLLHPKTGKQQLVDAVVVGYSFDQNSKNWRYQLRYA